MGLEGIIEKYEQRPTLLRHAILAIDIHCRQLHK